MNVPRQAKQRAEQSRRRCMRYMIDDETIGLWAEKPARQARRREQLRSRDRSQDSCFFIHPGNRVRNEGQVPFP
jgi:hypothetical protein